MPGSLMPRHQKHGPSMGLFNSIGRYETTFRFDPSLACLSDPAPDTENFTWNDFLTKADSDLSCERRVACRNYGTRHRIIQHSASHTSMGRSFEALPTRSCLPKGETPPATSNLKRKPTLVFRTAHHAIGIHKWRGRVVCERRRASQATGRCVYVI